MDDDTYVRRISAISLAYLGQSAGLPVLIDSLRFPSIDTSEYYDHDLIKDIAYFSGTDFPDEDRYDHKTWKNWWDQNGHKVDLNENLAIREKIETAFEKNNELEGLAILDRLLDQYPDNLVVKLRTVRFCNDWIVYRLQSRGTIGPDIIERCLRLQKKIVEIEPENPKAISKLAGFYARLGRFDDAAAAMKIATRLDPANKLYRQSLRRYETVSIGSQ
jgi:tetratricopeptide (TPR) repeat protein